MKFWNGYQWRDHYEREREPTYTTYARIAREPIVTIEFPTMPPFEVIPNDAAYREMLLDSADPPVDVDSTADVEPDTNDPRNHEQQEPTTTQQECNPDGTDDGDTDDNPEPDHRSGTRRRRRH